jgi:hypothetical protein
MIVFKLKTYSTPVGRGLYRAFRVLPGQQHWSAGRKAVRAKRFLNEQAQLAATTPVTTMISPFGTGIVTRPTFGKYIEKPLLEKIPSYQGYTRRVNNYVNRII